MRFWRPATSALLLLAMLAVAAAAVLYVSKDWLVALGVRVGIAEYNARMNSTVSVQDVALDLLTLTATVRGVSIAQHSQTRLEAPIYVTQASAKVRLWPLIRRQVVLDKVAVSGVRVRLQVDGQARVNLAELFRLVKDDPHKPSRWNVIIHHFTVDQAMVDLAFEGQPVRASLDQMAFEGAFTVQPLHVHADMLRGQGEVTYLRRQDRLRYHLSRTAATVDVYRKRLVIDQLRVDAREFTVLAHGGIDNAQVTGQFDIDLDLAAVAALIPEAPSPVGAFSLRGTLDGPLHQPRLQLATEAEGVALGPYVASKLSADVNLTGRRLQLERFVLGFAGGTIQGLGTLDLASEHLDIEVDVADVALVGLGPLAAHAAALVDGRVAGRMRLVSPSFNRQHMRVAGLLALSPPGSTQEATRARPLLPLPLALTATFHFENRTLTLEQATWTLDGAQGQLIGTLSLDGALQVTGDVAADLAAQTFVHLGLPSARGEAKFTFEVGGTLPEPRLKADLQLRQASYRDIPIESLALALEAEGSTVKIVSLAGAQWGGRYRVTGAIELSTPLISLPVNASALPIHSISGLRVSVERINLAKLALVLPTPLPLAGELTLHAKGTGPWSSLRGDGQIDVRGLVVRGEALGDVSLALEGAPTQVTLKRLLAGVGGGQLLAQGSVALPRPFVDVTMTWQGVHLDQLTALQGMHLPVSGGLNGAAKLRGLWPDLQAGVTVHGPHLVVSGLDVADLHLQATASAQEILLERLTTRLAGARFEAGGRVALHGPIDIRLSSESIPLRGLVRLPKDLPLRGRVQLRLTGSGSVETPQLRGHIELMGVQVGGMAIGTGTVRLGLDGRQLTFATAGLQTVNLDGAVTLDETLPTRVRLGVRALDLGLVSAWLGGATGAIAGEVSGMLEVNGPLRVLPSMSGRVTVDRLRLRSNEVELQNTGPLRWQLAGGVLQFESVHLQAQGSSLDVHGRIDLGQETLDIAISGTSPLAAVGTRIPGMRFQQGMVHTQMQMRGRLRDPVFEGQALIQDGALYLAAINEHLSQLKGEIQFAKQTIAIPSLTGRFAGGNIAVSGEARLQRFQLHDISLTAEVTRARLRYPTGFFTAFDAELVATGTSQRQLVTGEVRLGQARYRQELDVAWFMRQFRQRALEPPSKAEESLQLDIRVYTRDALRVENRLAKLQLAADLNVRGTPNRPVVLGRVDIEKGSADVGGSRFTDVSGSIDFLNPSRTEPFIDIAADTQKSGYQIHVMATGNPQQIDLRLTSEPALAEPDILSLLTAGATGQAITAGVGTVLPPRLSAFLTGQIAEEIGRGVGGIVGIDRLDIEPVVGGAQRVGGPKVTVGKDVSKNLSVSYSTVVGSTLEDLVTVEYRITESISLLGVRDERGDVGVDVKFSLRFE